MSESSHPTAVLKFGGDVVADTARLVEQLPLVAFELAVVRFEVVNLRLQLLDITAEIVVRGLRAKGTAAEACEQKND